MKKFAIACAGALLLGLPVLAPAAEICETVNDVANGWNALANLINETQGDGFTDEEVDEVEAAVEAMTEGSAVLAGMLQGAGNDHQVALGEVLEGVLTQIEALSGDEEVDYIVGAIDEVTVTLDAVTDDCDANAG